MLQNIAPDNHIEPITDKVRQVDWHGGFTAASNIAIYTARTYPREYWNRTAFISEPTGHLTATMTLQPERHELQGASTAGTCVASDDEWSAPIEAQVGPDGHVWVIDWYNFIVQHNPTPAGLQERQGQRLRDAAARQDARPHLPRRLHEGEAREAVHPEGRDAGEAGRDAEAPQHDVAAARPAAARWNAARATDVVPALMKDTIDDGAHGTVANETGRVKRKRCQVAAVWTLAGSCGRRPTRIAGTGGITRRAAGLVGRASISPTSAAKYRGTVVNRHGGAGDKMHPHHAGPAEESARSTNQWNRLD